MKRKKTIAPRLASGEPRVPFFLNLPDAVKVGIHQIARFERKSGSWVVEQVVIQFFGFDPEYREKEWKKTRVKPRSAASAKSRKRRGRKASGRGRPS